VNELSHSYPKSILQFVQPSYAGGVPTSHSSLSGEVDYKIPSPQFKAQFIGAPPGEQ
jgi:hypothetical protein